MLIPGKIMNKLGIIAVIVLAILAMAVMAASENNSTLKENTSKVIKLPEPRTDGGISVEKALKERRSIRSFGKEGLTLDEVSQLLWAAQGVTDDEGHRTAPSAVADILCKFISWPATSLACHRGSTNTRLRVTI